MRAHALIVDARHGGQEDVPCHVHAMSVYRFARDRGDEWIRVDKPGHACDFMVAALREQMNANPRAVPTCIVNAPVAEHLRLGGVFDTFTPRWQGASFTAPVAAGGSRG